MVEAIEIQVGRLISAVKYNSDCNLYQLQEYLLEFPYYSRAKTHSVKCDMFC